MSPFPRPLPTNRICLQWPRFGPYHLARLEAVHTALHPQGVDVIGLETAGRDATYDWRVEAEGGGFRREQVFPGRLFETLLPEQIHEGVVAALDRLQPDAVVINSYSFPDARACLWWCRRHRRVAVVVTDSKEDDAPRVAWREHLKARIVRQFDAALLAGTPHRAYFEKLGFPGSCIFLGYDVVDNAYFGREAAQARATPERFRQLPGLAEPAPFFLSSNRFIPRKNVPTLLRAYAAYRRRSARPWRMVLLGDGPERPALEALIVREHIDGVTLAGFRQIEELPAYYGLAGVFVHPALQDQWGLVVNEAMAAGLPVLVSERAGCAQDLVRPGENGYRFDPADADQLAGLLADVAASPAREAMGRRSREIIAAWSPETFAQRVHDAIRCGRARAGRRFRLTDRLLLWTLRRMTRSSTSFHTVEA